MSQVCCNGHPHLVSLLGWTEDPLGIAMKRYAGSLRDVLRDEEVFGELTLSQLLTWAEEIALGMMEVHR